MSPLLLVHGAFHGAWCWDKLRPELDQRGIEHDVVDLPFTSRDDDVAAVRKGIDALGSSGEGVAVLGHSFGGAVISAAAAHDGEPYGAATSLIYLTAVMTAPDQTIDFSGASGMAAIDMDGELASFDAAQAQDGFYHRCSAADAEWAARRLRTMPSALLTVPPPPVPAWRVLPSTYVICTDDRILSPTAQSQMASNAGATVSIDSDHSPFLSCPAALAELISQRLERTG